MRDRIYSPMQKAILPMLPHVWIGYLFGLATTVAEVVSLDGQPDLAKGQFVIPPLYVFLPSFVGIVYWLVCVHRIHLVLNHIPGWTHPISPARAAGFHLIPIYNLYWIFKWPREVARFVNDQLQLPLMKPVTVGITLLLAMVLRYFDPGPGLILMFMPLSYVSKCMRTALAASHSLPPRE